MSNTPKNRRTLRLTTLAAAAVIAAALVNITPLHAQQTDSRWQAFSGCWEPVDALVAVGARTSAGNMVCVVPVTNGRGVNIASISDHKIVHLEQINATGERASKTVDGCTGWESATWAKDGRRLFMRSEFGCGDSVQVKGSTVFSISQEGNWAHVQGNTIGKSASAQVTLFKPSDEILAPDMVLADSAIVRTVPAERSFAERMVRLAAAEPASVEAMLEMTRNTDPQVAQTWVAQFGSPGELNAKQLVALADAGMPPQVIDIMIAKAYPERFALQANSAGVEGARPTNADIARANSVTSDCDRYSRLLGYRGYYNSYYGFNGGYGCPLGYGIGGYPYGFSQYGYGYGYGFGSGYGYGGNYYTGSQPIIIVTRGSDGEATPQGRAVRGQGYTRDKPTQSSAPRTSSGSSSGSSSSGSSSSGSSSSGATSSGSSSGGGSTGRTAVPKTPPPSI